MKKLSKKTSILLIILLLFILFLLCFFGIKLIEKNRKVEVPNLVGKTTNEVYEWCGKLSDKFKCEIKHEETDDVEKDIVFYQSLNEGDILTDKISLKISSGIVNYIDVPDFNSNLSKSDIEKWVKDNKLLNVSYLEIEDEKVSEGNVIKIEPNTKIKENTPITIYISKGPKVDEIEGDIEIKSLAYSNNSVDEFEKATKKLSLNPKHDSSKDAYSDTVTKGNIVWHGSGIYEKNEDIRYGLSLGKNPNQNNVSNADILVNANSYIGYSENEIIAKGKELNLSPNHNTSRDAYSDTVEKGKVVWHGSGYYTKDETFNYGLSLGSNNNDSNEEIVIEYNKYINISPNEFETKMKELGLDPYYDSSVNNNNSDIASTISDGNVVWHGNGIYSKNEKIRYGIKGGTGSNQDDNKNIIVSQNIYLNLFEQEIINKANELNIKPNHDPSRDSYSDTIEKGKVVWHGSGTYVKDETFNYGLSLGKKEDNSSSTATILRPNYYDTGDSFESTKNKVSNALSVFPNVTYVETSSDLAIGQIEKIVVNGDESYSAGEYPLDTSIVVYIVNSQTN